jgi:hypothetical protein
MKSVSLRKAINKIPFDSNDDENLSVVFWVFITLDIVGSTWNCYQTTQYKIPHRMIHKILKE